MFTFTLASAARRLAVTLALFATRYASRLRRPSYRAVPNSYDAQVPAHTLPNRGPLTRQKPSHLVCELRLVALMMALTVHSTVHALFACIFLVSQEARPRCVVAAPWTAGSARAALVPAAGC